MPLHLSSLRLSRRRGVPGQDLHRFSSPDTARRGRYARRIQPQRDTGYARRLSDEGIATEQLSAPRQVWIDRRNPQIQPGTGVSDTAQDELGCHGPLLGEQAAWQLERADSPSLRNAV